MNQDRLLSDEELVAELWSGIVKHDSIAASSIGYPSDKTSKALVDLINTQKRLFAESVIGEDEKLIMEDDDGLFERIRNLLRAEQRARIK